LNRIVHLKKWKRIMANIKIDLPEQFRFLFAPMRYKCVYGGRSGTKSWSYAAALVLLASLYNSELNKTAVKEAVEAFEAEFGIDGKLIRKALTQPLRILNCREIQKSIAESAHRLIADTIARLGLSKMFTICDNSILCSNGSEFIFVGLFRNTNKIKSMEGIDIAVVWEAQPASEKSLDDLIPTIRTKDSEVWIEFNPEYEDDEVYKRYVANKPENCISKEINYTDVLQYVPVEMLNEAEQCRKCDPVKYRHLWGGKPIGVGGKIWCYFEYDKHVLHNTHRLASTLTMEHIAKHGNCFMAMDPHSKYYPFILWGAIVPKRPGSEHYYRVIYDEYPRFEDIGGYYSELRKKLYFDGSLSDLAKTIYQRDGTGQYGNEICKRYIDSRYAKGAGGSNWATSTDGILDQFAKTQNGGLLFDCPAEKMIDAQRNQITEQMKYNKMLDIGEFNEPEEYVFPRCRNLIQSYQNHRCEEGSEKEDEKYKDPSDARRILNAGIANWKYKGRLENRKTPGLRNEYAGCTMHAQGWMG
jgi:hypothetical protein